MKATMRTTNTLNASLMMDKIGAVLVNAALPIIVVAIVVQSL